MLPSVVVRPEQKTLEEKRAEEITLELPGLKEGEKCQGYHSLITWPEQFKEPEEI